MKKRFLKILTLGAMITMFSATPVFANTIESNIALDHYPEIHTDIIYFTLDEIEDGVLTKNAILSDTDVTDEEDDANLMNPVKVDVLNFNDEIIHSFKHTGSFSVIIRAEDNSENVTKKLVTIRVIDTSMNDENPKMKVRMISADHMDTLASNSVWYTDANNNTLLNTTVNNVKYHQQTEVSDGQALKMGETPSTINVQGSGSWQEDPEQVFEFSLDDIKELKTFLTSKNMTQKSNLTTFYSKISSFKK